MLDDETNRAADASDAPPDHGSLVARRVVARIIDDLLLTVTSVGIAVLMQYLLPQLEDGYNAEAIGEPAYANTYVGAPLLATVLTGALATVVFGAYIAWAARWEGVTIGRAIAGIKVVSANGTKLTRSVVFGRELTRVALVCASLAVAYLLTAALVGTARNIAPDGADSELRLIVSTVEAFVPIGAVAAGWIGIALIDPQGRTPHDRLARSRVVRSSNERSTQRAA